MLTKIAFWAALVTVQEEIKLDGAPTPAKTGKTDTRRINLADTSDK